MKKTISILVIMATLVAAFMVAKNGTMEYEMYSQIPTEVHQYIAELNSSEEDPDTINYCAILDDGSTVIGTNYTGMREAVKAGWYFYDGIGHRFE